jgi:hypothetical protein
MKKIFAVSAALAFVPAVLAAQSVAEVTQTGNDNVVTATQTGANFAEVRQTAGFRTTAPIGQPTGGHEATITQVQFGASGANRISLDQSYGTNALGPAGAHTASLEQHGSGNVIGGIVDGELTASSQDSRTTQDAVVIQAGDRNTATFRNGTLLRITQIGDDNVAFTVGGGTVTQYQEGNDNEARNSGNSAYQYQVGDHNYAVSSSNVSGSATSQTQLGDFNRSEVLNLRGSGNVATTTQSGDWNVVRGTWNQNSGNSLIVSQTSAAGISAAQGNSAIVDFRSTGNATAITQSGLANSAVVTQQ